MKEFWNRTTNPEPATNQHVFDKEGNEFRVIGVTSRKQYILEHAQNPGAICGATLEMLISHKEVQSRSKEHGMIRTANKLANTHAKLVFDFGYGSQEMGEFWMDLAKEIEGCK